MGKIGEWIWRRGALRQARSRLIPRSAPYEAALNQARLLMEVARRVAEPVESLPAGSRPAVLATLYRDAAFWALSAERAAHGAGSVSEPALDPAPADLRQMWGTVPPERLLAAAGGETAVEELRTVLVERSPDALLATTPDEVARGRAFVDAILWNLEAPTRAVEHVQVQRWTRMLLVLLVLAGVALGIRTLVRGPNLVKARVFKLSSVYPDCTPPRQCGDIFFHTMHQENNWIDFDLGSVKAVHQVEVTNRSDCCQERAIPLIVEVSVDDKQWIQVARRDTDFSFWKASFPKQKARYVRLRVPRMSALHFDDVAVR